MKHLTTPEFTKLFDEYPLYSQEQNKDPLIIAKLFDAFGSATWFLTEFNPDDNTAFCYVTGLSYDEWGYVPLTELEEIKHKTFGIPRIERDLYFTPTNFSRVVN